MRTSTTRTAALVLAALSLSLSGAAPARAQETEAARAAARAGAARKPAAKGSISGRVVGEGGEPLAQVNVLIRPRGIVPNVNRRPTLTTDEEGNFVARNLDPGIYSFWATLPGYVSDPEQASAQQGYRPGDFVTVRMVRGGVITGTLTDASGAPLTGLGVMPLRVRDHEGRPASALALAGPTAPTDDRGVYRIYGLPPGVYLVVAGTLGIWGGISPYDGDVPTFYPSSTRDTAAEVTVRAGQEVAGIDIRYREERGWRVSGTLALPPQSPTSGGINITLSHAGTGAWAGVTWVSLQEGTAAPAFSLDGIADGTYDLQAQLNTREASSSSPPLRVAVRGADVTGLRLALAPLASASGTLTVEALPESLRALPECKERVGVMLPQEVLVVARRDPRIGLQPAARSPQQREVAPEESGTFTFRNLEPGAYRFEARPIDGDFYARPFQLPAAAPASGTDKRAAGPFNVKAGQQLSGLSVRVAAGAAGLAGRVVTVEDGAVPAVAFSALRVHLVPAERERAEEVSFYAEATPAADGSFTFRNLAPGRYLLVARPFEGAEFPPRPAAWDADARARLRREAAAAGIALDLQHCQRVTDFTLRHPPAPGK